MLTGDAASAVPPQNDGVITARADALPDWIPWSDDIIVAISLAENIIVVIGAAPLPRRPVYR